MKPGCAPGWALPNSVGLVVGAHLLKQPEHPMQDPTRLGSRWLLRARAPQGPGHVPDPGLVILGRHVVVPPRGKLAQCLVEHQAALLAGDLGSLATEVLSIEMQAVLGGGALRFMDGSVAKAATLRLALLCEMKPVCFITIGMAVRVTNNACCLA